MLMGGELAVESEPGRGSVFSFAARFERGAQTTPEVRASRIIDRSRSEPQLRVLVAEDNEFNAQLLRQLLVRRGHDARLVGGGRRALELIEQTHFDLMLLDLHMPELDGFQVIAAVRERERASGKHLPVVALTARARAEDRARCLASGMDDFLAKPLRAADLWLAIERILLARPSSTEHRSALLDAAVLLDTCGDDPTILEAICGALAEHAPRHLAAIDAALTAGDAPPIARSGAQTRRHGLDIFLDFGPSRL